MPLALLGSPGALSTNGLNQIGFGAVSIGMGGADIAVSRDTSALNVNPAGLTQIDNRRLDLITAVAFTGNVHHKDSFGNDTGTDREYVVLNDAGAAAQLGDWPLTAAIALFAQGGSGVQYNDLTTAFGTRDDLDIRLRIARITPGIAWQVSDALSLGVSLVGTYSDLDQKFFPNTSFVDPTDPTRAFFGLRVRDLSTFETGVKLGAMFKLDDRITLGAAWTSKVDLDLDGGNLTLDMTAAGLGKVRYGKAEASGIDQPQEFGVGVAVQATDSLLLSAELDWIDWSGALNKSTLRATRPDNPLAPPEFSTTADQDWRDQYVVAVGGEYQLSKRTVLRAGYNYARNPIPDRNLNPLLAPITVHHLTVGAGTIISNLWRLDLAFEWDLPADTTYTNTALPFGPDAESEAEFFALHFMASRHW